MRSDACDLEWTASSPVAFFDRHRSLVEVRREQNLESEIAAEMMAERERRVSWCHEVIQNVREEEREEV